ncbi:MAG: AAA family ATPase [Alkalimonas sp.]|nr:AAA family ATPase [Alkalimonas sp.]
MLSAIAIENYRSILRLVIPLGQLTVVTGENGSGKSNLYKALRLLAASANNALAANIAAEGGLDSLFWAGSPLPSMGSSAKKARRLRLGFAGDEFSYSVVLGLPVPSDSMFDRDPEVKYESVWHGPLLRPASALLMRKGALVKQRSESGWQVLHQHCPPYRTVFDMVADAKAAPEVMNLREAMRGWRFYDHFRVDGAAPARQAYFGSRTVMLHHDGRDLASALQTILEIGDAKALQACIAAAFPGCHATVNALDGKFQLNWHQAGLLRPLSAAELSDGTLRFLLWAAALLTPRPPGLMILNEPEASLHPDLLPSLARLIGYAAEQTQLLVVTHSNRLLAALKHEAGCCQLILSKHQGPTEIEGLAWHEAPAWNWPDSSD